MEKKTPKTKKQKNLQTTRQTPHLQFSTFFTSFLAEVLQGPGICFSWKSKANACSANSESSWL